MASAIRFVLAALLGIEAVNAMLWLAGILAAAAAHDRSVLVMAALRAAITALQVTSAWMLIGRALPAVVFARAAFLLSAVLVVLEVGFRFSPSSLPPDLRVPVVIAYAIYAAGCMGLLRFARRG